MTTYVLSGGEKDLVLHEGEQHSVGSATVKRHGDKIELRNVTSDGIRYQEQGKQSRIIHRSSSRTLTVGSSFHGDREYHFRHIPLEIGGSDQKSEGVSVGTKRRPIVCNSSPPKRFRGDAHHICVFVVGEKSQVMNLVWKTSAKHGTLDLNPQQSTPSIQCYSYTGALDDAPSLVVGKKSTGFLEMVRLKPSFSSFDLCSVDQVHFAYHAENNSVRDYKNWIEIYRWIVEKNFQEHIKFDLCRRLADYLKRSDHFIKLAEWIVQGFLSHPFHSQKFFYPYMIGCILEAFDYRGSMRLKEENEKIFLRCLEFLAKQNREHFPSPLLESEQEPCILERVLSLSQLEKSENREAIVRCTKEIFAKFDPERILCPDHPCREIEMLTV